MISSNLSNSENYDFIQVCVNRAAMLVLLPYPSIAQQTLCKQCTEDQLKVKSILFCMNDLQID